MRCMATFTALSATSASMPRTRFLIRSCHPLRHSMAPVLAGPVVRDRTFYFGNFEQRQLNQSGLITILPASVAVVNARLDAVSYPGARISTGIYPNPVHLTNVLAKLDHQFGARDSFSARYSLYDVSSRNSRGAGALNAESAATGLENTDQTIAAGNVLTISPRTVNETRGQFTRSNLSAEPGDPAGPSVSIAGISNFGRSTSSPTGRQNSMFEVVNNTSHQAGSHSLRAGANFLYNATDILYPRAVRGTYAFSSLANFLQGTYNNAGFTQTFGNSSVDQTNPNIGFYAQDEWKIIPSLTLNVGIRYDLQFLKEIATDRNNISPRAGFAWSPFSSGSTVIRGGFGLYYDRIPLRAVANALLSSNNTTTINSTSQISISLGAHANGRSGVPERSCQPSVGRAGEFQHNGSEYAERVFDPGKPGNRAKNWEQGHVHGGIQPSARHTLDCGRQSECTDVRGHWKQQRVPANPNYANNSQYRAQADSHYDGLHVSYLQRPSQWSSFRVSYTYSKALNNVGEFFFSSPIDPSNLWRDYGRSDDDQRHRVVVNGSLNSPSGPAHGVWQQLSHGFQLGAFLQYY